LKKFPEGVHFKYSWRKYQQRVLDDLKNHLTDDHLHIIAPPGSGKTVLGLEVALRLNQPTMILAPTISIRNQWIQRFCELFLQTNVVPEWISRDVRNPKFLTVLTYQGLHAACSNGKIKEETLENEDEEEEIDIPNQERSSNDNLKIIVEGLKSQNIKTIVVDEAHHLKNEWWQTLIRIKDQLNPVIVGLTATPPFDVSATEWQRYIELNGSVDTEISVPELIIEGDLCPHQDYIYCSLPTTIEQQKIVDFRLNMGLIFEEIKNDQTLLDALQQHPIWLNPDQYLDWIYNNLAYYSAILIYLNANSVKIPPIHLEVIGDQKFVIPSLDYPWMETLLEFYLLKEKNHFKDFEAHQKKLENKLKRSGAFERQKIDFSHNKRITGFLSSSMSKLNAMKQIVDFEYLQLGKDLRLVILTDFIRKEFFVNATENTLELNKMGVIPIFEKLRRDNPQNIKIAVLTGSLMIIPKAAFSTFEMKAATLGIMKINVSEVLFDSEYLVVHQSEQLKHDIVHLITDVFQAGEIEVLVGTKSLLGEGWDAPAINTLILASFVGSFVQSNQMRGRAIRTQKGNVNKTGNIWHLACVDPTVKNGGGDDLDLLKRRFKSFVGVSFKNEPSIENGIGRFNLPHNIYQVEEAEKKNNEMFALAAERNSLKQRWYSALNMGVSLVEEIKIPFTDEREYKNVKSMYFDKTIKNMIMTVISGWITYGFQSLNALARLTKNLNSIEEFYIVLMMLGISGIVIFGHQSIKALTLYIKYRDISKDIKQIGDVLLLSLIKAKTIKTKPSDLNVISYVDKWGAVYCHLEGGTTFEKSTFINALQEIIAQIQNPRYVIIRKSKAMLFVKQRDYHSVPEILGRNKTMATYFESLWEKRVGSCELIFTRTIEGRKLLLKSRMKSLASSIDGNVEHVNKWR
jgi:superfamily II DNA or RNA helicase